MNSYVRWFGYEVYADPHDTCVVGSNVPADADAPTPTSSACRASPSRETPHR